MIGVSEDITIREITNRIKIDCPFLINDIRYSNKDEIPEELFDKHVVYYYNDIDPKTKKDRWVMRYGK